MQVFKGLTDRELHVFDLFEDEEYVKKTVEVSLAVSTLELYHPQSNFDCPQYLTLLWNISLDG